MKRKKPQKSKKLYWEMTTDELAAATREFDKPIPASHLKPLSKAQRAWWDRVRGGAIRSIHIRGGSRIAPVEVEPDLLRELERVAKRQNISTEELIRRGLRAAVIFGS